MSITFPGTAFGKGMRAKSCLHLCLNDDSAQVLSSPKIHALFTALMDFPRSPIADFLRGSPAKKIS